MRAPQRVGAQHVDVVRHAAQIARPQPRGNSARGRRQNHKPGPQRRRHAGRQGHGGQVVAFIIMKSALIDQHRHARQVAGHHAPGVTMHAGRFEAGDLVVVNHRSLMNDTVGQKTKARAKHDRHFGLHLKARRNRRRGCCYGIVKRRF